MLLGRVIGEVWATIKDPKLEGRKLLIVQHVDPNAKPLPGFLVAVDGLNTGPGELVLVAQGSSARQTEVTRDRPIDAVIMGIVDQLDIIPDRELDRDTKAREQKIAQRLAQQTED